MSCPTFESLVTAPGHCKHCGQLKSTHGPMASLKLEALLMRIQALEEEARKDGWIALADGLRGVRTAVRWNRSVKK